MDRREFLVSTFAGSLKLGAVPDRIKIAFLGASHSHAQDKVKVVQESARFELVAVWDEDPKVQSQYQSAGIRVASREELLGDKSVALIAVESAVKDHAAHARMALEAGKHLHLEKPPSDSMDSFRSLVALAERKQLLVQIGYMWRHNPGMQAALEAARRGWLGDVYLIRGTMNTLIPAERRPEWAIFRGGQMFEQGPHLIDPMVRLMGRPANVTPFLRKHGKYDDKLADNTVAVLEWPSALGIVCSATLQPGAGAHRSFEILGTNGTAVVRPIEPPALQIDLAKPAGPYEAKAQSVKLRPYRRYVDEFEEMAEAIQLRRPLPVTAQEDLLVQETLLRACAM